ncbi:HAD-like domain-containing protein [Pisolithus sp. B1]|nr:HAD-like domain-containing protein [Pisolithus sp. B1]
MAVRLSHAEHYEALLDKYDTWMFDCDGVLWHGDRLIEGAVQRLLFVTNNATKSRRSYKTKFDQLGIETHVLAVYISSVMKLPKDKKVYVIGMSGLEEELRNEGVSYVGGTDCTLEPFSLADFTPDPDIAAVLCGLDTAINYAKLSKAFHYLHRDPSCRFLVTNEDSTFPSADGLLPGAGAVSAPLRFALNRDPLSVGKPAKTMLDCIQAKVHFDPKRTIMIGDRLNTDILFGQAGGLATLLVLTGVTSEENITGPNASTIVPDYVTPSIADLRLAKSS